MSCRIASLSIVLLLTSLLSAEPVEMVPFSVDHQSRQDSPADVSFLLDAPAGKGGFTRVENGHLVKPDGERFRIWGVNLTGWTRGSTLLPPKDQAPLWAAELARFGRSTLNWSNCSTPGSMASHWTHPSFPISTRRRRG